MNLVELVLMTPLWACRFWGHQSAKSHCIFFFSLELASPIVLMPGTSLSNKYTKKCQRPQLLFSSWVGSTSRTVVTYQEIEVHDPFVMELFYINLPINLQIQQEHWSLSRYLSPYLPTQEMVWFWLNWATPRRRAVMLLV